MRMGASSDDTNGLQQLGDRHDERLPGSEQAEILMITIEGFVAEQLSTWEVPGCAVAAVRDGDVVLNAGFGTRELGEHGPVSTHTIFPIGSTTKSFTAAGVGKLVDEGLLDWDRPLRDYLPGFAMHDPVATERLTVLDFLSHRSGLPRHEFVWLGLPDRSRAGIARRLRQGGCATALEVPFEENVDPVRFERRAEDHASPADG